jgi:surface antigen
LSLQAVTARFALLAALCLAMVTPAEARSGYLQCVPFARQVSGIDIRGNAWTWWEQAAGRYERGGQPKVGSVMSFKRTGRNPYGHVAMVSKIVSDREVLLTHANWSYRGGIERNVRAVDVSAAGDWSEVKVWYAPNGGLGTTVFPVNGFIYSDGAPEEPLELVVAPPAVKIDMTALTQKAGLGG